MSTAFASLALGACSVMHHVQLPPKGQPEITLHTPTGPAVVRLVATQPELTSAWLAHVRAGRYAETNIYRAIPGYFTLVGEPGLDDTAPTVLPPAQASQAKPARGGQVGLLMNPNGTHGPQLIFMLGNRWGSPVPPSNTLVGGVVRGEKHLQALVRGDALKITAP